MARRLVSESWPLLASGLAVMIYMRIDQVMLAMLGGDAQAGQFAAALRISEVWYFIPGAVATAAFPVLLARRSQGTHSYERYLQNLYDSTAWIGITTAVVLWLSAPQLIDLLYGAPYREAVGVLQVQIWGGVAAAMSFVHGKWLLAEGLQRLGLYYTLIGCVVNVTLNVMLIPRYGAIGAAWSTLASQLGVLPVQLLFPRGRRNFVLMLRSLWAPLRLLARLRETTRS
jgi:O-antigen/teichoic acid export membrane protein